MNISPDHCQPDDRQLDTSPEHSKPLSHRAPWTDGGTQYTQPVAEELNILLVESDERTAKFIADGLSQAGHVVVVASSAEHGLRYCVDEQRDILIINRVLPGMDGLSLLRTLRDLDIETPILFLTNRASEDYRTAGRDAGADDCLTTPFAFSELLARINSMVNKSMLNKKECRMVRGALCVSDLAMDLTQRVVTRGDRNLALSPQEFLLLEVLLQNIDRVLSRKMLLEKVWDIHFETKSSIVDAHLNRLKTKLDQPTDIPLLHKIADIGYCIRNPVSRFV